MPGKGTYDSMILQGDLRANDFILRSLFEHECQFFVKYNNGKAIRVAFNKGNWQVMDMNEEYFIFDDSSSVVECENNLLAGLLEQRKEYWQKNATLDARTMPSLIMTDVIAIWIGSADTICEIDITQAERNGWFNNFDDV